MDTKAELFKNMTKPAADLRNKVTIVGSGMAANAIAFSLLTQNISNDVVIVGRNLDKVEGEVEDMRHGLFFLKNARITGGNEIAITAGSKLVIFAAGARPSNDVNQVDLVHKNAEILKMLVPPLIEKSPDCILLVVTSPCDILTKIAWKISNLPANRVFGSGTHLDTTSFRHSAAQKLGIAASSVHGWIIGEQGEYSFPVWSSVVTAGSRLRTINPKAGFEDDRESWAEVVENVIKTNGKVARLKGHVSWGIGLSCADLASSIIHGGNEIKTVSTLVKNLYGIEKEVFLSLPCVLNTNGISSVVNVALDQAEKTKLQVSANFMEEVLKTISF